MFKKIIMIFSLLLIFIISACTIDNKQGIHLDGSVVMKQEVDYFDFLKKQSESNNEDLSDEEIMQNALVMAEGFCSDMIKNYKDDIELKEIFFACEVSGSGKLSLYHIFAPGALKIIQKKDDIYKYYLSDFIIDNQLDGSTEADYLSNFSYTLYFRGEIISSDIGVIKNNKLSFHLNDVRQISEENKEAVILINFNNDIDKLDNLVFNYNIDEKDSFSRQIENQSLNNYFNRIKEIWGFSQEELRVKLCEDNSLNYPKDIYRINCLDSGEIIIEIIGHGVGGRKLYQEHEDYYQYYLMEIIDFRKIYNIDWIKTLKSFPDNSSFNFTFFSQIIESDIGIVENNKLLLNWEELNQVNESTKIKISNKSIKGKQPVIKISINNSDIYNNLKGQILLQVESAGEAYYVSPNKPEIYFLGRPDDAFSVMREQGIGITNSDLAKIPVSLDYLSGKDSSGDGLPDAFKIALGLDVNSTDSDGDGYSDYEELFHGFDPLGPGRLNHDLNFAKAQAGRILLQVEQNGEAWYVSPENNKRYFLGRPADAFSIMRNLGLGISNSDLDKFKN